MRPTRLELHNFKSFADADIDLGTSKIYSLQGENGSGKSSLGEAILFPLTGCRSLRDLPEFVRDGTEECRVAETFLAGGKTYKATRTVSIRGESTTSTLELVSERESWTCEADRWRPEGSGVVSTERQLRQILGIDEKTLLLTNFIGQEDSGAFFRLPAGERIDSIAKILRIDETYRPIEKHFKGLASEKRAALDTARRDLARLEEEIAGLKAREIELQGSTQTLETVTAQLASAEEQLKRARERARVAHDGLAEAKTAQVRAGELRRRREAIGERREALERECQQLERRVAGKDQLEADLLGRESLRAELAALEAAERADAALGQERAVLAAEIAATKAAIASTVSQGKPKADELDQLRGRRASLQARIREIEDAKAPICDRCGQPIADEALARTLEQLRAENDEVGKSAATLGLEVENLRAQLAERKAELQDQEAKLAAVPPGSGKPARVVQIQNALEKLSRIPAQLAEIRVCEERAQVVRAEMEKASAEWSDDRELEAALREAHSAEEAIQAAADADRAVTDAENTLPDLRARQTELERAVARHEETLGGLGERERLAEEFRAAIKADERDLGDFELLKAHFGNKGVQTLIIANVLEALEAHVNEILAAYNGGFGVRFDMEKVLQSGESRDSLEIMVHNGRFWRRFESFSGGQRYRVASSMRLALARLLAHRSGAQIDMAFIDEPEGLDLTGRSYLMRILGGLSQELGLVLLCSHYPDLKDALPSQINFSLDDEGLSHVEVLA